MLQRIIRIAVSAAAALALMLEGGCIRTDDLTPDEGTPIAFSAGHKLLRDDVTTKSTTDDFTINGESFVVFGEKVTASETHTTVFNGVAVSHTYQQNVTDEWGYTIPRFWAWTSQSDRYDFVAVYYYNSGIPSRLTPVKENTEGPLTVAIPYSYDSEDVSEPYGGGDKEDILAATYRRTGSDWAGRFDRVPLEFHHMGSAVAVTVVNTSSDAVVTVTSIYYQNLVVSATAKVSFNNFGETSMRWANPRPCELNVGVRKLSRNPATAIQPQTSYTGEYQIMIPQDLNTYGAELYLTYKKDGGIETTTPAIPLASIKQDDGTAITSWEIGYKYTYIVSLRLDGGLLVMVTTTPWDPVQGETPGILI